MKLRFKVTYQDTTDTIFTMVVNDVSAGVVMMKNQEFKTFVEVINLGIGTKYKDSETVYMPRLDQ